jgi:hypothetical protein
MRLVRSCGRVKEGKDLGGRAKDKDEPNGGVLWKPKKSWKYRKQNRGQSRLFYCLPIGPVASSVWVSHRNREEIEEPEKDKENDGRQGG